MVGPKKNFPNCFSENNWRHRARRGRIKTLHAKTRRDNCNKKKTKYEAFELQRDCLWKARWP